MSYRRSVGSVVDRTVRPRKAELLDLQSAMRDVQVSIRSYHDATAGFHEDARAFETQARSTMVFIQKVNDVLRSDIGQSEKFRRIFQRHLDEGDPGAETIEGFRYARNAEAHHLLSSTADPVRVVGGVGLGFQTSARWGPVPQVVHKKLYPQTKVLQPYYLARLLHQDVVETFLDAAAYLASVCPQAAHRDGRGEWTGFPLRSQPGLASRLHPEEPRLLTTQGAFSGRHAGWMLRRRPGGDFRLICGRDARGGVEYCFGMTFRGDTSFDVFVETVVQVERDVAGGFPYYVPREDTPLTMRSTGVLRHGASLGVVTLDGSVDDLEPAVASTAEIPTFSTALSLDDWDDHIRKALSDPLLRRNQRMATVYPPT